MRVLLELELDPSLLRTPVPPSQEMLVTVGMQHAAGQFYRGVTEGDVPWVAGGPSIGAFKVTVESDAQAVG